MRRAVLYNSVLMRYIGSRQDRLTKPHPGNKARLSIFFSPSPYRHHLFFFLPSRCGDFQQKKYTLRSTVSLFLSLAELRRILISGFMASPSFTSYCFALILFKSHNGSQFPPVWLWEREKKGIYKSIINSVMLWRQSWRPLCCQKGKLHCVFWCHANQRMVMRMFSLWCCQICLTVLDEVSYSRL